MSTSDIKSAKEIAVTALSLWDMHAEESEDEHALGIAVARGLIEFGLQPEAAATAAVLVKFALAAHSAGSGAPGELASQPIFQAALEELQSGNWSFE